MIAPAAVIPRGVRDPVSDRALVLPWRSYSSRTRERMKTS
jgi:hypothetical protein